jgi:hypothetical protein
MSDARHWVIGRAPDCDIVMGQTEVSGKHCRLSRSAGAWSVEDLGSSNGTFVNGRRLAPHSPTVVTHADTVTLGAVAMPWPERPSAPSPVLAKTVVAAPPQFDVPPIPPVPLVPRPPGPRTPVPESRPRASHSAPPPNPMNQLIPIGVGVAIGMVLLGGLIFLFWQAAEPKDDKDKEKTTEKDKKEKDKDKDGKPAKSATLLDENFEKAADKGDSKPKYWTVKDAAVMTDANKLPCLEPTLNRQGVGAAGLPLAKMSGDFTIQGDAYIYPSLGFVLEGDGPRIAVTIDMAGRVKINDNAPRGGGRSGAKRGRSANSSSYKIVRTGSNLRVFLNDNEEAKASLDQTTAVNKLQILLGTLGNAGPNFRTRLYSIKVTRD